MKFLLLLCVYIGVVAANVCQNSALTVTTPLSGSFGMTGITYTYFTTILEDQDSELLYFVGIFRLVSPHDTIIYKTGPELTKLKVMTYDIDSVYISYAMNPSKDFIYFQDQTTSKLYEIRTSDLLISRELGVSSTSFSLKCNMKIGMGFYYSFIISSVIHTCRWNLPNTNLDCFTFGVDSPANFAPINEELLFFGSVDTVADQYYLINYNFTAPSSIVWKKSIACPTSGCQSKYSGSLQNEDWIYTMVLYDQNFIFHKLSVTDGSPQNSGLIYNDSGYYRSYSMEEFSDFIAVLIQAVPGTPYKRLILINPSDIQVLKEYNSVHSLSYDIKRLIYQGEELMYHLGIFPNNQTFFFARSSTNNIGQLNEFQEITPLFMPITTNYQVSSTASTPSITTSTKTMTISTSSSISTTDLTSSINPTFTEHVALWNEDHIQSVQSNSSAQLNFTWACAPASNGTIIAFNLAQTGTNSILEWVQLDAVKQELYLNTTPKLTVEETFYFSLQISFNSEIYYKKFEITVEECSIQNCVLCKLGNSNICETCEDGYLNSNEPVSCSKIAEIPETLGTAEAEAILVASSVVLASASSILSLSSINSIFSLMNSLQLATLLPLVPDYFSPKVLDFLSGMGFTMLSFDFIKFKDLPFAKDLTNWVSYPQSDQYLNSLGMRSGSSVVNYLSLMAIILLIAVTHFGVYLLCVCIQNSKHRKCKKFMESLFKFFTFNIYIRVFIQAFMFTTLSIFSELYNLNLSTTVTKISFGLCVIFCICTSVLFLLSFYMYYKSFPQVDSKKYWPCVEYFNGIKPTKFSKLYSSLFMLVRLSLISLLIFGQSIGSHDKATYFYLVNIAYGAYLILVRPFENLQDNIIEIINQIIFCCLAIPLSWLNTEEAWTPFYEKYYTTIFIVSPAIGSIICLGFLIKSIIVYIYKRKSKKTQQSITPKEPSPNQRAPQIQELPNSRPPRSINQPSSSMSRSNALIFPRQSGQTRPHRMFYPQRTPMRRKLNPRI
ncbi:unnamed protein product [Moneuplotes crassus]|uniref:TRP C-terminal domain-containing protein n=1 Tax=Euplotes crassus TaxID=5936 RepID=A0AAD1XYG1_EUPCR|nr:unnamed protein product [Moneuplotes crassus]